MKIMWLQEMATHDRERWGTKIATLGELSDRYAVPPGFCLQAQAIPRGEELPVELALRLSVAYAQLGRRLGNPTPAVALQPSHGPAHLNLTGLPALTEAVRQCLSVHRQSGPPEQSLLVQQFIPADVSGVAYSLFPEGGGGDEVLVQAAWGLGQPLAGGGAAPDLYRVARGFYRLLESQIARKGRMVVAVPDGTAEVAIPRFLRAAPSLSPEQAEAVAQLAANLEAELGRPVRIDFAFAQQSLHLLDCQPLTHLPEGQAALALQSEPTALEPPAEFPVSWDHPTDREKYWLWDRAKHPDQVLPLYAAFFTPWVTAWERENQNWSYEFRRINTYLYKRSFPLPDGARPGERPYQTAPQIQSLWQGEILPELQSHILQLASMDLTTVPRQVLRAQLDEIIDRYVQIYELHWRIVNAIDAALQGYRALFAELFPEAPPLAEFRPLLGLETKTLESGRALWRVSRSLGDLVPLVAEGPVEGVMEGLRGSPAGQAWLAQFSAWLERYGRRFDLYDWSRPSWLEEPTPALQAIRAYLAAQGYDPEAAQEQAAAERESALQAIWQQLAGYPLPVRQRFDELLRAAQAAAVLKEDHHFWIDQRAMYEVRRALLTLGRRQAAGGLIDQPDSVWYLTLDELREAISGAPLFSLHALVAERRTEMARWAGVEVPAALGTRPPRTPPADPPEEEEGPLKGIPGSPGKVRGRVRTLSGLTGGPALQPGEVLVVPTLTSAWSPLSALAAAVVTEAGDAWSHGAILARESRIPAVLGVHSACRRLAEGQWVEVDGSAGLVRPLSE